MKNREIKFRAWNPVQHKMLDLAGLSFTKDGIECLTKLKYTDGFCHYPNDENILMQYTGLKDKNGVEIYDGDILSGERLVEVYIDENTGAFMVKFHGNPNHINKTKTLYSYLKSIKQAGKEINYAIIGNIYETPELLTTK